MATNIPPVVVHVRYNGSLRQWRDAIFQVPLENIIGPFNVIPHVGEQVKVKKKNIFSGRVRVWNELVVSHEEVAESQKLMEENDLMLDDDDVSVPESPTPPGSVTMRPKKRLLVKAIESAPKKSKVEGMV